MKLTALDIRKQEFARTFRGYDPEEVESFLQVVAIGWQEIVDELRRSQEKISEQQLKLEHYMKVEEALEEALQTARSSARQTIESAEKKASDLLEEAENRIVSLQKEADTNRLEIKRETARYAVRQQEIVAKLRAFLVSEMEMLRHFEADTGDRTIASAPAQKEIEMVREDAPSTPGDLELDQDPVNENVVSDEEIVEEEASSGEYPDGHDEPEDATEQEEEWDDDDEWDDDEEDEYDDEDEDDWEEDDDDAYFEDESDDSEDFDEFDSEAESDESTPGWKVTPVFESVGDDEGSTHQGDPLPEDSADDEIKKIHEILKGLDEEQDAEDE